MHDMIILGGGMVGAATALGLAKIGFNVALIEKNELPSFTSNSPYDLRISAISTASVALLNKLGAWKYIEQMRICPYDGLETWEIDGFNTAFHASDLGLDKLGFMVENNVIQQGLWQTLNTYSNCTQAVGFSSISAKQNQGIWTITLDDTTTFSAPLIIACDGSNSLARKWAGIGLTSWQYRQHCLLAIVETKSEQQSTTWQQFFPSGPRAFLPLSGHNGCVVWYDSPTQIHSLMQQDNAMLSKTIEAHFPNRLGKVKVVQKGSFPLSRQHAQQYVKGGIVLVGDAAHTINPLAGQGVNLGFKDVNTLLIQAEKVYQGGNITSNEWLRSYEQQRKPDNLLMQSAMDVLYKAFKSELLPVKIARNIGLIIAQHSGVLKKRALQYALGL